MADDFSEYEHSLRDTNGECGFCYPREQGKHGEVRRVFSMEWGMYMPLCRKHSANMNRPATETNALSES